MRTVLGMAVALAMGLVPSGCVTLQRGGIFPPDRDEIFVEYFDNATFFRNVEFELTERLVEEILSRPGLQLTSKENAEIILTGRILGVNQSVLSENPERQVTAGSATVSAVIEVRDARSGEILMTKRLSQRGEFVPSFDESQLAARRQALAFLARDILRELEQDF